MPIPLIGMGDEFENAIFNCRDVHFEDLGALCHWRMVRDRLEIGSQAVIGMGAVVRENVAERKMVVAAASETG